MLISTLVNVNSAHPASACPSVSSHPTARTLDPQGAAKRIGVPTQRVEVADAEARNLLRRGRAGTSPAMNHATKRQESQWIRIRLIVRHVPRLVP